MKEIGESLRKAREEKGISLKDVHEATKIRLCYLEAIDEGNLELIPGEVYRKGFIINYADAIGIDGRRLLEEYSGRKQADALQLQLEMNNSGIKKEKVKQEKKKKNVKFTKPVNLILAVGLLLAIAVGVVLAMRYPNFYSPKTSASSKLEIDKPVKKPQLQNQTEEEGIVENKKTDTETSQIYPAPVTVYAEFTERVWVQVEADGKAIFIKDGLTFEATSPKQLWTAQKELIIRMGNPGGIHLTINGKDPGPVGERGIPKTIRINENGLVAP